MNSSKTVSLVATATQEVDPLVTDNITYTFLFIFRNYAAPLISMFGVAANLINILVFIRLGVLDSSNLSFLALSVSDIFNLLFGVLLEILCNDLVVNLNYLTFDPSTVGYLTAALFSRMTCCITVFITVERCLCVASPLKVKLILTSHRVLLILMLLFLANCLINFVHVYTGSLYLAYRFDPAKNKTVLGMAISQSYEDVNVISAALNTVSFFVLFAILITSTIILLIAFHRKATWHKNVALSKSTKMQDISKRDRAIGLTIVALAILLILTYLPYLGNCILSVAINGFNSGRAYSKVYDIIYLISLTLETVNSSSSIIIYYKMSSQYRKTFQTIVTGHSEYF